MCDAIAATYIQFFTEVIDGMLTADCIALYNAAFVLFQLKQINTHQWNEVFSIFWRHLLDDFQFFLNSFYKFKSIISEQ